MVAFEIIFVVLIQFIILTYCDTSPSIVIVGAGPAGIAAASKLLENNFTNVRILEAEGRIGGRIHSVKFGDGIVDLGAEWCHGQTNNVVYEMVKELGLLELDEWSPTYYHSSGEHINQTLVEELTEIFNELYYGDIENVRNLSTGDYIIERYNETILERYGTNPEQLKFAYEFLNIMNKYILLDDGSFSWFDTSAESDFEMSYGTQNFQWNSHGYKTFLDVLMKTYPDSNKSLFRKDTIILNKEVTKIVWDDQVSNGGSVECLDKSMYIADHVIFTPSLGVLKERYDTLFHPHLTQEKISAIKELGIAAISKVLLHFPQRWWSADEWKTIMLFWSEKDRLELLQEYSNVPNSSDRSWLLDLVGFNPIKTNPNVIEAWFGGTSIQKIESLPDEQIVDGVMFILNKFLGQTLTNITKPNSMLRFNWYSNPHFRGTYSYQTVASRKREVSGEIALSKPLTSSNGNQVLLFAGEATSPTHYATVHGAVETGFREADRIINLYK